METLERAWETLGNVFGGALGGFEKGVTSLFGSSNARLIKRMQPKVDAITALESKYEALTEDELRGQTDLFRERLLKGETLDDILIEAFAVCREAGKRFLNMRHYDVQMVGGMVLHSGAIAEMVTGEGKTLVATLPAYLNAIEGKGVHVVTVNDYLARRDMEWMAPLYMGLGLTVGTIQSDMPVLERQRAYACNITYGTNNEFGFDYLRDNMRPAARGDERFPKDLQQSQGKLNYAIIDEVDNILIDEARTPLIISGPAHSDSARYAEADRIARQLKEGEHFEVKEKEHSAHLTEEGVRQAEKLAGVESFYTAGNMEWPHLMENSLKAHHLYRLDRNYVVREGKVIIVDEHTGRLMDGRQWSDGLHQAVEAKEGVKIKKETQTLATITLQNFFKLYGKICGMTGTAMTEANEFWKIYQLDVIAIPTNREMKRIESADVIYRTEREKYIAVAEDVERHIKHDVLVFFDDEEWWGDILSETDDEVEFQYADGNRDKETVAKSKIKRIERRGRPVLIGTTSIEKSERLSNLLEKRGVKHQTLNAKFHEREADIVAQAGRPGTVTIATNMAGRGTDIILGGNPETMAWAQLQHKYETRLDVPQDEWDSLVDDFEKQYDMKAQGAHVKSIGGLHVIGTERHESRRIDLQLRGRTGRQGDPGSSLFYLSLEDDLMRIFAGEWVKGILQRLGMQEGEAIRSKMVTRRIEAAQKKVEERNFEMRKNLLEYDEVMDEQRKRIYGYRQSILDGFSCKELVLDMIEEQSEHHIEEFLAANYGQETFASFAAGKLGMSRPFEPRTFRGAEFGEAERIAKDEALRNAVSDIQEKMDENLPAEEDTNEWNWEAMARFSNSRWGSNLRDRDLKKEGRDKLSEHLIEIAQKNIEAVNLDEGEIVLDEEFGIRTAIGWVHDKFGIALDLEEVRDLEPPQLKALIVDRAREMYQTKEAQYPVMAGLLRFTSAGGGGASRLDREALISWAANRFDTDLDYDDFKNKQRDEITELLVERSKRYQHPGEEHRTSIFNRLNRELGDADDDTFVVDCFDSSAKVEETVNWLNGELRDNLTSDEVARRTVSELRNHVTMQLDEMYRPEMRRMERAVLLQIVDTAWKDHLLAMDHLRSSIGLVGYAQLDAKVEYKREGMKLFEDMWETIGARVTDLIFRMEQLNDDFVGSTWVETEARHDEAAPSTDIGREQQEAIQSSQGDPDAKSEPIRNRDTKVGRNDPCPCGSGKKYKQCCSKRGRGAA